MVSVPLERQGRTYLAQAGIRLRSTPAPLYQTLVLANLLSARIRADIAVSAARALFDAGLHDGRSMARATWQERVDALGRGGYRRYDERMLSSARVAPPWTGVQAARSRSHVVDTQGPLPAGHDPYVTERFSQCCTPVPDQGTWVCSGHPRPVPPPKGAGKLNFPRVAG
ncbi:hypothetical protein ACWGKW_12265 [Streptomyces sp. NPDC054766]